MNTKNKGLSILIAVAILFGSTATLHHTIGCPCLPGTGNSRAGTVCTTALNVRSGPATTYNRTGVLSAGTQVEILEETSGWYRITAAGMTGYVSSKYICASSSKPSACGYCGSTEHIKTNYCPEKAKSRGAIGRWSIPDVGVNVAIFPSSAQSVCDAKDSACYFAMGDGHLIADHKHQGFNAIKKCKPGMLAYVDTGDEIQTYVCADVIQGHNTGYILTDQAGNDLSYANPNGITCYTCNNNWRNVTIVFFQPV